MQNANATYCKERADEKSEKPQKGLNNRKCSSFITRNIQIEDWVRKALSQIPKLVQ